MFSTSTKRLIKCFLPVSGIALLFIVGWVITSALPDGRYMTEAGNFLMLIGGIIGWSIGVVVRGYHLHCGGTQEFERSADGRYTFSENEKTRFVQLLLVLLVCGTLALVMLFTTTPIISLLFLGVLLASIFGEIGWGKPLWGAESIIG